ncbi:MAG: cytochrome c [Bacteroidota bacterium]
MKKLQTWVLGLTLAVILTACAPSDGNFTGSEYMPDMAHSLAVEANTNNNYAYNTWDDRSTIPLAELVQPREPVKGTVPRSFTGGHASDDTHGATNTIIIPANGHVPYHYANTPEGRDAAIAELLANPYPITEAGLATGENLYTIFCATCHGEAGNGLGYLYDEDQNPNAKYPLAPANFLRDEFYEASNGRYYHAIHFGYNAMGAYKDKMSWEERWQVIHYIRALQAKELNLEYSAIANTLNAAHGTPEAEYDPTADAGQPHSDDHGEEVMTAAEHGDDHGTTSTK